MAPRQRDYHAEYLRRQELAAERFPNATQAERTAHARGHRSTSDLESALRSGRVTNVDVQPTQGPDGRYTHIDIIVEQKGRAPQTYRLQGRQATSKALTALKGRLRKAGVRVAGIEYLRKRKARGRAA